ncbi:MAG: inorganic phosphate transporter [Firmicutes bacterium]|nr:inorganic phosphate transporter [Bacillota bacterium]
MPEALVAAVAAAVALGIAGAWNDAPGALATAVSPRALAPHRALVLAVSGNLAGAFLSVRVAETISRRLVHPDSLPLQAVLAAILAALAWTVAMTLLGFAVSPFHALLGGLVGAAVAEGGWSAVSAGGLRVTLAALLIYPLLGGVAGYLLMGGIALVCAGVNPHRAGRFFRLVQGLATALYALGHAAADAQTVMGAIALALAAGGRGGWPLPGWVRGAAALAVALGTLAGGWVTLRRLRRLTLLLQPVHAFAAQAAAGLLLVLAGGTGLPVSTSHTLVGALLGVGAAARAAGVGWGLVHWTAAAWIATPLGAALLAFCLYRLLGLM